jgi:putative tricarboxylic transport membrane protein
MARYGPVIGSIGFIAFAIGCLVLSLRLPLGTPLQPMPGFVPSVVSVVLLLVSSIHLAQALRGGGEPVDTVGEMWKRPALVVVGLLVYSFALDPLGYILSTAALSLLVMRVFEPDAWVKPLAIAVFASVLSYAIFDRLLDVHLPPGVLQGFF